MKRVMEARIYDTGCNCCSQQLAAIAAANNVRGKNLVTGCVGAIDGMAVKIAKPRLRDAQDPKRYCNRKHFYAIVLHVQAIVDDKCRCAPPVVHD